MTDDLMTVLTVASRTGQMNEKSHRNRLMAFLSVMASSVSWSMAFMGLEYLPCGQKIRMTFLYLLSLVLTGLFQGHVIGRMQRRRPIAFSFLVSILVGYLNLTAKELLPIWLTVSIMGVVTGLSRTAFLVLIVDVTPSSLRTLSVLGYWTALSLGLLLGFLLQSQAWCNPEFALYALLLACLALWGMRTRFRAPEEGRLVSLDRFLLPGGWPVALALLPVSMMLGGMITSGRMPFLLLSVLFSGLLVALCSVSFLLMLRLTAHCRRVTSACTCLMVTETGVLLGLRLVESFGGVFPPLALTVLLVWTALSVTFLLGYLHRHRLR